MFEGSFLTFRKLEGSHVPSIEVEERERTGDARRLSRVSFLNVKKGEDEIAGNVYGRWSRLENELHAQRKGRKSLAPGPRADDELESAY